MRIAFFSFVLVVLILSLYPLAFDWSREPGWNPPFEWIHSRSDRVDVVLNLIFYFPLGFTAVSAFWRRPGRSAILWATLLGTALSYGIEVAQLYLPRRYSNWRDVILNAAGTALGAWIATLPWWRKLRQQLPLGSLKASPVAWWLLLCWTTWLIFPFYPAFQMVQLRRAVEHTLAEVNDPAFPVLLAGMHVVGGAMLFTAARVPGMLRWLIPASSLGVLGWMMFIQGLRFSPGRVLATLVGFGLARLLNLTRRRWLAAALSCGWLAFQSVYRADFGLAPHAFHWHPLGEFTRATLVSAVRIGAGKALLISAAVWSLRQAGCARGMSAAVVIALVAVGEWCQRFAPGRSAALLDIVLAGAVVAVVLLLPAARTR